MSAKHFQLLVVKALWDRDFRGLLFSRPEEAMKDFDLTHEERAELRRMERERFEDLVVEYRLRLTKEALGRDRTWRSILSPIRPGESPWTLCSEAEARETCDTPPTVDID